MSWLSTGWDVAKGWFSGGTSSLVPYLVGALVLTALLGWLFWSRADLQADLAQSQASVGALQTANRAKAATIDNMKLASALTEKALGERDKALKQIAADSEKLRGKLDEVLHDPKARAWADEPLPPGVLDLLRQ